LLSKLPEENGIHTVRRILK